MRVYEAKLTYEPTLFEVGAKSLSSAEAVYEYMKDTLEAHPMHEVFYVVLLNQKNKPLGRIAISTGTVSATLVGKSSVPRFSPAPRRSSACTTTHRVTRRRAAPTCISRAACAKPPRRRYLTARSHGPGTRDRRLAWRAGAHKTSSATRRDTLPNRHSGYNPTTSKNRCSLSSSPPPTQKSTGRV